MELFLIYLMVILPNLGGVFTGVAVVCGFGGLVCCIAYIVFEAEGDCKVSAKLKPFLKWLVAGAVSFSFLSASIPTHRGMQYLVGGYVVVKASEIEGVKDLPPNFVKAANKFLEKYGNE